MNQVTLLEISGFLNDFRFDIKSLVAPEGLQNFSQNLVRTIYHVLIHSGSPESNIKLSNNLATNLQHLPTNRIQLVLVHIFHTVKR